MNFVIHWNETAMGLHVFPIPIPPPVISSLTLFLFKNILFNVYIFLDFSVVYYWFLVSFHFVCRRKLKYSCGLTCHPFWRVFLFLVHLRRMYILLLLNGGNLFPPIFTYIFTSCCSLFFCIDLCFLLTSVSYSLRSCF